MEVGRLFCLVTPELLPWVPFGVCEDPSSDFLLPRASLFKERRLVLRLARGR